MSEPTVTTFSVCVAKNEGKNFNVMKFNGKLDIDFCKWTKVKMTRENNSKEFTEDTEKIPEFGAGSEFGRKEREEAKQRRFGKNRESYKANDQPWILKARGDSMKKYKGDREGGVGENAAYYVFTHGDNGTLRAYPLQEWYNFQSIQPFKTLTSEEAEEEYSNRTKCLNLFSIMLKKGMKNDSSDDEDEEVNKGKTKINKAKGFKVSEQIDSSSESSGEESDDSAEENLKNRKKKTKNAKNKKKLKRDTNVEAIEDSDDGDDEGRECDYISSDSSESEHDEYSMHGVSEEKGLKVILNSDEDDSEDEEHEKEAQQNTEHKPNSNKIIVSDFSSDSDTDNSTIQESNKKINKKGRNELVTQSRESFQNPKSSLKRKQDSTINEQDDKKPKTEYSGRNVPFTELGITEEVIRRYLNRKPTTLTELIAKFKLKTLNNEERKKAEAAVALILRRIKPKQESINDKIYFSL